MSTANTLRWITGVSEIVLGVPVLGALFIVSSWYTLLAVMFVLHLVTLILSIQRREVIYGSVLGVITSCIAWIPFVGMVMHIVTGILLCVSAANHGQPRGPLTNSSSHNQQQHHDQ